MTLGKDTITEHVRYDNLVDLLPERDKQEQPAKPKQTTPAYPFTMKVNTWTLGGVEKLALALQRNLSSDEKAFRYVLGSSEQNPKYEELRQNPFQKKTTHKERIESTLWQNTVEYQQDGWVPYITFKVTFECEESFVEFCKRVKQRLGVGQAFMSYPASVPKVWKYHWVSD